MEQKDDRDWRSTALLVLGIGALVAIVASSVGWFLLVGVLHYESFTVQPTGTSTALFPDKVTSIAFNEADGSFYASVVADEADIWLRSGDGGTNWARTTTSFVGHGGAPCATDGTCYGLEQDKWGNHGAVIRLDSDLTRHEEGTLGECRPGDVAVNSSDSDKVVVNCGDALAHRAGDGDWRTIGVTDLVEGLR